MITNVWVKYIGILVVFVVAILAVAWYLPKLSPSLFRSKMKATETPRIDSLGWLPSKVEDQWYNPIRYIYGRLIKVFSPSPTKIGLVVEWFNCSVYGLKFESVSGEVRMGEIGFDFESL